MKRRTIILFRGNNLASLHPNKKLVGSGLKRKHSRHYHHGGAIALPSFDRLSLHSPVSTAVAHTMPSISSINDFITHRGGAILKSRPKGKKPIKFLM